MTTELVQEIERSAKLFLSLWAQVHVLLLSEHTRKLSLWATEGADMVIITKNSASASLMVEFVGVGDDGESVCVYITLAKDQQRVTTLKYVLDGPLGTLRAVRRDVESAPVVGQESIAAAVVASMRCVLLPEGSTQ